MVYDGKGWYGVVLDGIGWYGMVWYGLRMVWDGKGWYGTDRIGKALCFKKTLLSE